LKKSQEENKKYNWRLRAKRPSLSSCVLFRNLQARRGIFFSLSL